MVSKASVIHSISYLLRSSTPLTCRYTVKSHASHVNCKHGEINQAKAESQMDQ